MSGSALRVCSLHRRPFDVSECTFRLDSRLLNAPIFDHASRAHENPVRFSGRCPLPSPAIRESFGIGWSRGESTDLDPPRLQRTSALSALRLAVLEVGGESHAGATDAARCALPPNDGPDDRDGHGAQGRPNRGGNGPKLLRSRGQVHRRGRSLSASSGRRHARRSVSIAAISSRGVQVTAGPYLIRLHASSECVSFQQ
jgi:hypothetical protein